MNEEEKNELSKIAAFLRDSNPLELQQRRQVPDGKILVWYSVMAKMKKHKVCTVAFFEDTESQDLILDFDYNDKNKKWFFEIYNIDYDKLKDFCLDCNLDYYSPDLGKKFSALLTFRSDSPVVLLPSNEYWFKPFNYDLKPDKIIEYIHKKQKYNTTVSTDELVSNGVLNDKNDYLTKIFENTIMNKALKPFAAIYAHSMIMHNPTLLSEIEIEIIIKASIKNR